MIFLVLHVLFLGHDETSVVSHEIAVFYVFVNVLNILVFWLAYCFFGKWDNFL